jgi:NosR/NirI family nitrous oxide reductase transcriptional regulator
MRKAGPARSLRQLLGSRVKEIGAHEVALEDAWREEIRLPTEAVFVMIGRDAPIELYRKSGVTIAGERSWRSRAAMLVFVAFCTWLYHWKGEKPLPLLGKLPAWLDPDPARLWQALAAAGGALAASLADPATLLGTVRLSASGRSFWYTLAYSLIVVVFGVRRIRRRRTPYVTAQTLALMAFQVGPLFLLPEIVLPFVGHNGWLDHGPLRAVADAIFPVVSYGHGREYWRAYGFILAWPLFVHNAFTAQPLWAWLAISAVQTFVITPALVLRFGKGAYCGWICSCGALAETLGDTQRHKMPHGPAWNRVNLVGQGILAFASVLLALRIVSWIWPASFVHHLFESLFHGLPLLNYAWFVDLFLAGIVGYGAYFWYSGRVWCRFACPLAALMHLYARFSSFRILAEKKKCISCNVCTSVCHQGIDVMSFANKGLAMEDPECVRCSACVQSCPTGVLTFGTVSRRTGAVLHIDRIESGPQNQVGTSGRLCSGWRPRTPGRTH